MGFLEYTTFGGDNFVFSEILGTEDVGHKLWPCATVCAKYLERQSKKYAKQIIGKRWIELGAGCGLTGQVVYRMGARTMILTDLASCVEHLHNNATRNFEQEQVHILPLLPSASSAMTSSFADAAIISSSSTTTATVTTATTATTSLCAAVAPSPLDAGLFVMEHAWGTDAAPYCPPFDGIIACDCLYAFDAVELLIASLLAFSSRQTTILLSGEKRCGLTHAKFFAMIEPHFTATEVKRKMFDKDFNDDTVFIFVLKLKTKPEDIDKTAIGDVAATESEIEETGGETEDDNSLHK